MFGAGCLFYPPNWKLASLGLLRRYLVASVHDGRENSLGNAIGLFRITGVLFRRRTWLVRRLKSALSDRRGNNGRQLEVVSHAPPYNFDRLTPVDFTTKAVEKHPKISAEWSRQRRCGGGSTRSHFPPSRFDTPSIGSRTSKEKDGSRECMFFRNQKEGAVAVLVSVALK
jgi:hypothetical protein